MRSTRPRRSRSMAIRLAGIALTASVVTAASCVAGTRAVGAKVVEAQQSPTEPIYETGKGVTPPKLTHEVDPVFPRTPPPRGSVVVVDVIVGTDGLPHDIKVARSLAADFDQNALDAVRQYRFVPAMREGKPVAIKVSVVVNFQRTRCSHCR